MTSYTTFATFANILNLVRCGGEIERSYVVELLVEGGYVEPPVTEDYREPLKLTAIGEALTKYATVEFETLRMDDEPRGWEEAEDG